MKIQSLSIVIPTKRCVNNCSFCVSKMHDSEYENNFSPRDIKKRLKYAANNGVNTIILTGTGEALQNKRFLEKIHAILDLMDNPFPNIELQTTGVLLDHPYDHVYIDGKSGDLTEDTNYPNIELLNKIGVNTISLSVSDIFSDENNMKLIGVPKRLDFKLNELIKFLKSKKFNVRLSLNMTLNYDEKEPIELIQRCKELEADQITFRQLYNGGTDSKEDQWVRDNCAKKYLLVEIDEYIRMEGEPLYQLPYGPIAYSIDGMSTVLDDDCMSEDNYKILKYLILREDGRLYCRWDDKGSLIF